MPTQTKTHKNETYGVIISLLKQKQLHISMSLCVGLYLCIYIITTNITKLNNMKRNIEEYIDQYYDQLVT